MTRGKEGFDAVIVKLLWPLVESCCSRVICVTSSHVPAVIRLQLHDDRQAVQIRCLASFYSKFELIINNPLGNLNSGRSPGERSSLKAAVPTFSRRLFNYHFAQTTLLFQISTLKRRI